MCYIIGSSAIDVNTNAQSFTPDVVAAVFGATGKIKAVSNCQDSCGGTFELPKTRTGSRRKARKAWIVALESQAAPTRAIFLLAMGMRFF